MARPLVPDRLWSIIEPLLPPPKPAGSNGRPPVGHREALTGILFVLRTGIPWEYLPVEMGCGSGMTCWRRLRDWQAAGIWDKLLHAVLQELAWSKQIDWSRASLDSASLPAKRGARRRARTRRTVGGQAPSAMSSPTATAPRSPSV
ncbi:transposase [Azospirillum doebereinerae]|uniref:Transposase n=1 Tax=Azospirillum doebereinerae TaxID=92933 RepID=A0A3S0V2P3_9PROT|nr:transposase [Azospirillum doebereinerae]